jgi:acetyltransferase-like isoleucine patch superfamily enzyme
MKAILKAVASATAAAVVAPAVLAYRLGAAVAGAAAFPGWAQALALAPGLTGVYLRRAFYRRVLPKCGPDASIGFGSVFSHPTAEIGRGVYVGAYCVLGDVTLGDDVLLGSRVSIANGGRQHGIDRLDAPVREQPGAYPRVTIGRDTWVGEGAIVLADVGAHCVIGAGAVVIRPVPDLAVAVGVPARVIRYRGDRPTAGEPDADVARVNGAMRPGRF